MNQHKVDISVVIVNWSVRNLLKRCLESIYKFTQDVSFEVFVVDNNSTDGSQEMVSKEFPQVTLIVNTTNRGFAAANNQGFRLAEGRYTLMLNPDTELNHNAIKAMVEFMDQHPKINVIAPRLTFADGSLQHSCRHFPTFFTDLMESLLLDEICAKNKIFNWYKMGLWPHDKMREVDQPYGACLMFRTEDLKRLGFMDERFFMYYDEVDLCLRLKKAAGKIFFLPQISIIHHGNCSSKQIPDICHRWKLQSKIRFFAKHYGAIGIMSLFFNLILETILVYGIFSVSHAIIRRPRNLRYFKAVLKSIWGEYIDFLRHPIKRNNEDV